MEKIRFWIRKTFGFSQKETNGFLLLSFLIVLFFFIPSFIDSFYLSSSVTVFDKDQVMLDSMVREWRKKSRKTAVNSIRKEPCTSFDPNLADESLLNKYFGKRVAGNIIRYRLKGGIFSSPEQLRKIYGMNDSLYEAMRDCLEFPRPAMKKDYVAKKEKFDINLADSIKLQGLKGIGKVLSSRIVRYREKLGGFVAKDQYKEIYGLDSLALSELEKFTFIASDFVPERLDLSLADAKTLYAHPYIGKEYAKKILQVKSQKKDLSENFLKEIFPSEKFLRLKPYLYLK